MYEQKQDTINALIKNLKTNGVTWPSVSDVLHGKAPSLPPKWHWRTRGGIDFVYAYYERSDIIVVPSRYESSHV